MKGKRSYNDRSVDSKLRMILNGDATVNSRRAEYSGAVRIAAEAGEVHAIWQQRAYAPAAEPERERRRRRRRRGKRRARAQVERDEPRERARETPPRSQDVTFSVFVEVSDAYQSVLTTSGQVKAITDEGPLPGPRVTAKRDRLRSMQVTREQLIELVESGEVPWIEPAQGLRHPTPRIGATYSQRPTPARSILVATGAESEADGEPEPAADAAAAGAATGVLIGIIDVGGFDFDHPDFLRPGANDGAPPTTRFVSIWDQGGELRPPPTDPRVGANGPSMYDYGSEITRQHMNTAIAAARAGVGAPAWRLEPQSVMRPASHGTHVASIAAGNSGVCPDAEIAGVLVDIPELSDSRLSFYDTSRIVHAVEWLVALAESRGLALSVNVSLATNGHAHDASSAGSRWLDAILATPGRAISVAAGNSGQEAAASPGDRGWIMGRIHSEGRIPGPELTHELEWLVVGDGAEDISENELELWYSAQDRFSVRVRTPDGRWLPPVERNGRRVPPVRPGDQMLNEIVAFELPDPDGGPPKQRQCFVSIANDTYHPANGANRVAIYLSPDLMQIHGILPGRWLVRLQGDRIRDGHFHAWIERDDPGNVMLSGSGRVRRYPSFFSERSNVDRSSVSSLACGHRVVSVANLDAANDRINPSSSQGPTRDGRPKPEVAAPGTDIVAARGFATRSERWVGMTGTSMASPYVCGVAARMLIRNPRLTAAQIGAIMRATARPLPSTDYSWHDDAGYGVIDPDACVREAGQVTPPREVQ